MGGIFGTISKKSCVADLFYGTDYNSHLGTRRGGLATYSSEKGFVRSIHNLESSYFRTKFEPTLNKFEGATSGIGVISDTDAQPLIMNSHLGRFAICTVAKIVNKDELTQLLLEKNMHFAEMSSGSTNPTELVALLIIQGKTFREGIENVFHHIKGSCTMMILTEDGIICARDSWGRTPIIIGKKEGAYAASSETTSFPNLDYETAYEVGPGEIVKIKADGMEQIRPANKKMQVCSFLWVYYGFPTSTYEGKNVEEARFTNGFNLAKTDDVEVDCCSGIPDSGTGMAMGYAAGKGVPYQRCIAKYTPTWPRSFTPSNQSMRSLVAKMKLIPNKAMLKGKRVLFCDDSIVRGTQLRDNVKVLFDQAGLKECHMRIACPPFGKFDASKFLSMFIHQHHGIRRLEEFQNQFSFPFLLLLFAETLGVLELRNGCYVERHIMGDALGIILDARNEMLVYGLSDQNEFCLHFVGVFFLYTLHLNSSLKFRK
jgi:amidophosphoribosyltransferase